MSEAVYFKRQFLNTEADGGVAFVKARVGEGSVDGNGYANLDAELTISDCNRQITLDFSVYGSRERLDEEIENIRTKLRRLRTTLAAFDRALTDQLERIEG